MTALDLTNETTEAGSLVAQFVSLRERLIERRGTLTTELRELDAALGVEDNGVFLTEGVIRLANESTMPTAARADTDITELRPESILPRARSRRTHDEMVDLESRIRGWLIHWKEPRSAEDIATAIHEDRDAVNYSLRRMTERSELTTTGAKRSTRYMLVPHIAAEMAVAVPDDQDLHESALEASS